MIAILDYKAGNQTSVFRGLKEKQISCEITCEKAKLFQAEGVIFPGVGAALQAMTYLKEQGLDIVLKEIVDHKIPLLGLCLGSQILLDFSEEQNTTTLGIVHGKTIKFSEKLYDGNSPVRIPHMGWNSLNIKAKSPLLEGISTGDTMYFVHSYYTEVPESLVLATTNYGIEFTSIYGKNGLWGVQGHPEKSGEKGLKLLENFANYCHTRGSYEN